MKGNIGEHGKDKHGRTVWKWTVDVAPPNPVTRKRNQKAFYYHGGKRDAKLHFMGKWHEIQSGSSAVSINLTVGEYLGNWVENINVRDYTRQKYKSIINAHLTPSLGQIPLKDLSRSQIKAYYTNVQKSGRKDGRGKSLSSLTAKHHHEVLHKAMADAVEDGLISNNPAYSPKGKSIAPKGKQKEMETFSADEANKFLASARQYPEFPPLALLFFTGARPSEGLAIIRGDVNWYKSGFSVSRSIHWTKGGEHKFEEPKSAKGHRFVHMPSKLVEILKKYQLEREVHFESLGHKLSSRDLFFTRDDGSPFRTDHISKVFKKIVRSIGLPHMTLYGLRHTYATLAMGHVTDIDLLCRQLGHSDPAFTIRQYGHARPGMGKIVASAFVDALDVAGTEESAPVEIEDDSRVSLDK